MLAIGFRSSHEQIHPARRLNELQLQDDVAAQRGVLDAFREQVPPQLDVAERDSPVAS
jgi:hypothetical protein